MGNVTLTPVGERQSSLHTTPSLDAHSGESVQFLASTGVLNEEQQCNIELCCTASFHSHLLFSLPSGNCSELRSQIYMILEGLNIPDVMAMNSGSQPDWTRVITQKCPVSPQVQLNLSFML